MILLVPMTDRTKIDQKPPVSLLHGTPSVQENSDGSSSSLSLRPNLASIESRVSEMAVLLEKVLFESWSLRLQKARKDKFPVRNSSQLRLMGLSGRKAPPCNTPSIVVYIEDDGDDFDDVDE
ncbi:hypothetical protein Sjap_011079 [Stephania japonica]|uniref:Uncharacterized protein n=1 Tax=Stephania japonica TaxID=461633 RepID=A0AAP0JCU4_9MAGN